MCMVFSKYQPKDNGFTMVELILSVVVVTLVLTMMVPAALNLLDKVKKQNTRNDLVDIQEKIDAFHRYNDRYPDNLSEVYPEGVPQDPWGSPYQYLNIADVKNTRGKQRKFKGRNSINSDYDLYSMGPDGESVPPLTGESSRDDIIRGYNGRFIGNALDFK